MVFLAVRSSITARVIPLLIHMIYWPLAARGSYVPLIRLLGINVPILIISQLPDNPQSSRCIQVSCCISEEWLNILHLAVIERQLSWKCFHNNNIHRPELGNPFNPHDALKHHFTYLKYDLYCYYFPILHCIALHCIALHCIALHCIALHCIALHCIALHCIALHCIDLGVSERQFS